MAGFFGFIETILEIIRLWNVDGLRRLRNSALVMVLVPLFVIVPGAFVGAWSFQEKIWVIESGMLLVVCLLFVLAARRVAIGAEIGTIIDLARSPDVGLVVTPINGAERYIRFVAAVLASEVAVGFIALWLRAHNNPAMALLTLFAALCLTSYAVWQKGEWWWANIVKWLAVFTLVTAIVASNWPEVFGELASQEWKLDSSLAAMIRGDATPRAMFWLVGLMLIAASVAAKNRAVKYSIWMLVFMLLIQYFVWGAGARTVDGQQNQAQGAVTIEPQARELADGMVEMGPGARFILGAGIEKTFSFGPLGVAAIDGKKFKLICDPLPCRDRNGQYQRELARDLNEWTQKYHDQWCYREPDPFKITFRADPSADFRFRARTPKDPPCN